ncbi:MAG: hypothetical protein FWG57_04310 [Endomicrobia bacterium]|nr:hypothetical protein [Endomicrobiia bacterium]
MNTEEIKDNNENLESLKKEREALRLAVRRLSDEAEGKFDQGLSVSVRRVLALWFTLFWPGLGYIIIGDIGKGIGASIVTFFLFRFYYAVRIFASASSSVEARMLTTLTPFVIFWIIYSLVKVYTRAKQLGY